ncbi:protein FAR1-RELATED SEQUENCE 5-like [Rhizophagus irregularis DAOM 181602=DAOM 197198]|nr:protein FAR1-RELATED SEQUENCE 5-like [Rhizophagus irregularis DAOM 181602=DAOM 197198]
MELDWISYINFPKDSEDTFYTPFPESNSSELENITPPNSYFFVELENITIPPNSYFSVEDTSIPPNNNFSVVEPLSNAIESIKLSEPLSNDTSTSDYSTYQYNLTIGNSFDDWESVDRFIHKYCLERGFGYQVYQNDKDLNDHTITRRKSFRCSLSGNYEARKKIDQNEHRVRDSNKTGCEWHCNFKLPKTEQQIRCTTLVDVHNHELNPTEIAHLNARYRQFNDDMVQDLRFFTDCKVVPIIQLEILKKKHPHHVFHKQDVYNSIYKLRENCKDESPDSGSFLNSLFEKMTEDPNWKVFIRHSGNERRLSGIFWMSFEQQDLYHHFHDVLLNDNTCKTNKYNMYLSVFIVRDNYGRFRNMANALVEDEMASTYTWILQCLTKATTVPSRYNEP